MVFFIQFGFKVAKNRFWKIIIQLFGIVSMVCAILIFTKYHDLMTILSSFFGFLVVTGIIMEVYISTMGKFKISGVFCILLLGLNNFIYYGQQFIEYLPLVQKITFAFVLVWIISLNYAMYEKRGDCSML